MNDHPDTIVRFFDFGEFTVGYIIRRLFLCWNASISEYAGAILESKDGCFKPY